MVTNPITNKSTADILKSINILLKYDSNAEFRTVSGLDAIIFGISELTVTSSEDEKLLRELGWEIDTYYTFSWMYFV